jgi:hypothetical protein
MGTEEMAYQKALRLSAVPLEVIFSQVYVAENSKDHLHTVSGTTGR